MDINQRLFGDFRFFVMAWPYYPLGVSHIDTNMQSYPIFLDGINFKLLSPFARKTSDYISYRYIL